MLTQKENYIDKLLLEEISSSKRIFWAGTNPPLSWFINNNDILDNEKDNRLPCELHQSFEIVYLSEINLGEFKNWPLILDEALRLLEPEGLLFIKMTDTPLLSIFELKNFINSWGTFSVYNDINFDDGTRLLSFRNQKKEKRLCNLKSFSFGVLSNGLKIDNLKCFIDSVLNLELDDKEQIEVIICGPRSIQNLLATYGHRIVFIEEPENFKSLGWITKKKNMIVECAKNENLIIAHDRYIIPRDFVSSLKVFGKDWNVLVCKQELEDGTRIPDWVTLGSDWEWTTPGILEYGDWSRYNFINGGIIIAKKETLLKSPWNELLFWNQAEDVELSRNLRRIGIVPRLARNLKVTSLPVRKTVMEGFEQLPFIRDKHVLPGSFTVNSTHTNQLFDFNKTVTFSIDNQSLLYLSGFYIDKNWDFKSSGISLKPYTFGLISFVLKFKVVENCKLILNFSNASDVKNIFVNNKNLNYQSPQKSIVEINLEPPLYEYNTITKLIISNNEQELLLRSIVIKTPQKKFIFFNKTKDMLSKIITAHKKSRKNKCFKYLFLCLAFTLLIPYLIIFYIYKVLKLFESAVKFYINKIISLYFDKFL